MSGFTSYCWYLSIKQHFTTEKYDIIKSGIIPVTQATYDKKGGVKYAMERLARKYSESDLCQYFIANFINGDRYGGIFSEEGPAIYLDWMKRKESLSYMYEQDLTALSGWISEECKLIEHPQKKHIWECVGGKHPIILRLYLSKRIMLETLVILEQLYKYRAQLDETLAYDPVWKSTSKLLGKSIPFIDIEVSTFREITERIFS
jgi:hypothetical protein